MIEENMLRGSLVSSNEAKGGLGFKGERGYSAYEIAVQHGYEGTEQEWIDHFGLDLTNYAKTTEVDTKDNAIKADIGDIEKLTTVDKTNVVSAINEHQSSIEALDDRGLYSTTEKVIGTWIDGKPIYRVVKTATTGSTGGTSFVYTTTPSNIDTMIKVDGILTALSARFPINAYYDSSYYISAYYDPSGYIRGICGSSLTNRSCLIILEYTKTTD